MTKVLDSWKRVVEDSPKPDYKKQMELDFTSPYQ